MEGMSEPDDPVEVLRRWEDFGAVWQVGRLVSGDPALREYVDAQAPVERAD
jgi:hypothetical protein